MQCADQPGVSDRAAVRSFRSVRKPTGHSSGHRRDDLNHFAILSLDGPLDGLLHVDHAVCLEGRRQLSSLGVERNDKFKWEKREEALRPPGRRAPCYAASALCCEQVKLLLWWTARIHGGVRRRDIAMDSRSEWTKGWWKEMHERRGYRGNKLETQTSERGRHKAKWWVKRELTGGGLWVLFFFCFFFEAYWPPLCRTESSVAQTTKTKKKKTALQIRGFMSQSWMMTMLSDSLFPWKHAQGSPEHTCSS